MNRDYLSPLRYPGAKRQIAPHIKQLLQEYGYVGGVFVEPCCGGASVSLYLLKQKVVSSVILIDKDPWVASFWQMMFRDTDNLLDDIKRVEVSVETWKAFRAREPQTVREKALYCFFFNRTGYSGILSAGMIGGYDQTSKYKIDCRFNKTELLERIKLVAELFSDKVQEVREDSVFDVLEQARLDEHEDQVYYVDPPYVRKGLKLYPHNFKVAEHKRLNTCLEQLKQPWILSYHDHKLIQKLYLKNSSYDSQTFDVLWVADRAKRGTELPITNLSSIRAKQPIPIPPQQTSWTPSLDHTAQEGEALSFDKEGEQTLTI